MWSQESNTVKFRIEIKIRTITMYEKKLLTKTTKVKALKK